ncbi:MAG: hypothetical protein V7742_07515 [Halioglobus sp.]
MTSAIEQPWLDRKDWCDNYIVSDARYSHRILWVIAALWHVFTIPLYLNSYEIWQKAQEDPLTLIAFIFPLAGIALIAAAVQATRVKHRFGETPLVLDPFPGSLGGQVGGTIDTSIPFDPEQRFDVSLRCIRSSVSGSGKNRSRKETIQWSSDGISHAEADGAATRLRFRFDLPRGQSASDAKKDKDYILWRVQINCEMEGPDFSRSWVIPVFDTGQAISGIATGTESHHDTFDVAMEGVESVAEIRPVTGGIEAWYPAFQRPAQGVFALLFGLVFLAIGVGVGLSRSAFMMAFVFSLVGGVIASYGVYYLGKALMVSVTQQEIKSRRYLYGYRFPTRAISKAELLKLEIKQAATIQSGRKTTVFYQILAYGPENKGKPIVVGERLASRAEAELMLESYYAYLGMTP